MVKESFNWKLLYENPVLVYGAGIMARAVSKMLLRTKANLLGMAVTTLSKSDEEDCEGIKICRLEDWQSYADDAVVLIATSYRYHEEIKQNCLVHGFKNVISIKPEVVTESFKKILLEKGVSLNEKCLFIGNGNYVNPFIEKVPIPELFLACLGDFVMPSVFNDYSMVHEGPYEYGKVKLSEGDIVFDLGANMGVFSVFAVSKGCISYAFDPTPELKDIITLHSSLNNNKIHYEPFAVSNHSGQATFRLDPFTCAGNSLIDQMLTWSNADLPTITVPQISVDEFVEKHNIERVDFIKADIEGAERLMLEGAVKTLKTFAPKLALCTYHLPDDKEVLTRLILKANSNYIIEYKWEKLYAQCVK